MKNIFLVIFVLFMFTPSSMSAHQPRIVNGNFMEIKNPEVSQAFYGELRGTSTEFQIKSDKEFSLYVGILVPDISNIKKDISVEIYKIIDKKKEIVAILDGNKFKWTPFYEEFAKDNYFWGPEYKATDSQTGVSLKGQTVPAGDYRIKVYSSSNTGKYTLVTGYLEVFPINEILKALFVVPQLKLSFFNEPLITVLLSPLGWGSILALGIFVLIVTFILSFFLKKVFNSKK